MCWLVHLCNFEFYLVWVNYLVLTLPANCLTKCVVESTAETVDASWNNIHSNQLSIEWNSLTSPLQSGEVTATEKLIATDVRATDTIQEVVQFLDENEGQVVGECAQMDPVMISDETPSVDLSNFLKRPVRIINFTWAESDTVGTIRSFDPWFLFFNDARIKYKLNNFSFIQADLKLKIMINASPFYYGAMIAAYQPLPNLTTSTIVNDAGTRWLIPYSQRPHLWIYPQNNEAGTMTLPYFNFRNWIRIQVGQDFTDMGNLKFINYTTLQSANGVTAAGVSIQVYAWAENVRISGPSVGLALQAGDEYGQGVVSGPASAIASIASRLTDLPVIGRFATATRIGAGAVSAIASLFGFTNVPVIADAQPFRPCPFPQLASSEIGYPIEKLTLDPKNELTVDPVTLGLTNQDELAIPYLVQKESLLTTMTWATTDAVDDILFTSIVTPWLFDTDAQTQAKVYLTPMAWVGALFQEWRGDIIFRFRFICSQYHKGRVRISFDPAGYSATNLTNDAVSSTVVFTKVVDLGKDSDVEIRIPYQQAIAWLLIQSSNFSTNPYSISKTPSFLHNGAFDNGTITVRVLTALTAPVLTSNINCLVFVRGADNLEFANPSNLNADLSYFPVQSGNYESTGKSEETQDILAGISQTKSDPNRYLVNFGESIGSLRKIMRRTALNSVMTIPLQIIDTDMVTIKYTFGKWPLAYGYDPSGIHSAKGLVATTTNFNFNFAFNTAYNWIAPAYVGTRGSMMWQFNVEGSSPKDSIRVWRKPEGGVSPGTVISNQIKGTISSDARFFVTNSNAALAGQSLTSQRTQAGMNVLVPNYNPYRFQTTRPRNSTQLWNTDASDRDEYQLEISLNTELVGESLPLKVWCYSSIGTDLGLYFFLNVPTVVKYSAIPVAN